jgi:hypothetical protein
VKMYPHPTAHKRTATETSMKIRILLVSNIIISGLLLLSLQAMAADARTSLDPFRAQCDITPSISLGNCTFSKSVPAGKRLILETVTGAYDSDGTVLGAAYLTIEQIRYTFPWVNIGTVGTGDNIRKFYGFNHYVQLYVDGPAALRFDAAGGGGGGTDYRGWYSASGYLVDHPPKP